jgi:hypothetical protein
MHFPVLKRLRHSDQKQSCEKREQPQQRRIHDKSLATREQYERNALRIPHNSIRAGSDESTRGIEWEWCAVAAMDQLEAGPESQCRSKAKETGADSQADRGTKAESRTVWIVMDQGERYDYEPDAADECGIEHTPQPEPVHLPPILTKAIRRARQDVADQRLRWFPGEVPRMEISL